jgi:hypothetical protein
VDDGVQFGTRFNLLPPEPDRCNNTCGNEHGAVGLRLLAPTPGALRIQRGRSSRNLVPRVPVRLPTAGAGYESGGLWRRSIFLFHMLCLGIDREAGDNTTASGGTSLPRARAWLREYRRRICESMKIDLQCKYLPETELHDGISDGCGKRTPNVTKSCLCVRVVGDGLCSPKIAGNRRQIKE